MVKNTVLTGIALTSTALWCAAWYVPLLATGATIKAVGKVMWGGK